MEVTENPTVSQVIAALEGLIPGQGDPFMILGAPRANGANSNYFQVLAADTDYCCEARIFDAADFQYFHCPAEFAAGYFPALQNSPYVVPPKLGQEVGIRGALMLTGL